MPSIIPPSIPAPSKSENSPHPALDALYGDWFLDYASYVILERAVPHINDGLKPVQRRILHSMREMEDGRYNKVANIVGNTMKYHPHGDASITDALVQMGQKNLLIDTQGNWGNYLTGDRAAAARYIEARLTKFALEVVFNSKTTEWSLSYDGRNQEPVTLPVKFPLLLAHGAEGIAVGLSCKILPHNFNELIDACIATLRKEKFELFPDFATGGLIDTSDYQDGQRGGRIRSRARIEQNSRSKYLLTITEIPFGTNTNTVMDSIVSANEKGKIKVAKVEDNTAESAEILIHLPAGADPGSTIQALYAFTACEQSIAPNAVVIQEDKPRFLSVTDLVKHSTEQTRALFQQELEIALREWEEKWHFASLEKIFIEKRIYRDIEECETWEEVLKSIWKGLKPYLKLFKRQVTDEDITRLTEIKIKRISKYNSFKADEVIASIEEQIAEINKNLRNLTRYTIRYFKELKKNYGKNYPRRSEITSFKTITAAQAAIATETLYLNDTDGFAGYALKRGEGKALGPCSRLDDIIAFRTDGTMLVTKISEKAFVGKKPLHLAIFKKSEPQLYNLIYRDGKHGAIYAKRFEVGGVTRDKQYDLTKGTKGSRVLWFSLHTKPEESASESILLRLKPALRLRKLEIPFTFSSISIKGRSASGNIVTRNTIQSIIKAK